MIESPFVSVCIQTYQHKKFIASCIESVLMQITTFPFEIIIGEDDSTDGTREICKEFAERFPCKIRLYLRSEKDKIYINGVKTGRFNFLSNLQVARGKYIALMDGDDCWIDEYKLQKQVAWMEANPEMAISTHNVYWKKENGAPFIPSHLDIAPADRIFSLDDLLKKYFLSMSAIVFLKKYCVDLPSWYNELPVIDYPLTLHLAQKGSIGFMKDAMGIYNIHRGGMWNSLKPPKDVVRLWKLYTLLAVKFNGKIRLGMEHMRKGAGKWLIHFYRTHWWYDTSWFRNELSKKTFDDDVQLFKELTCKYTGKEYFFNIYNASKAGVKKIIRR